MQYAIPNGDGSYRYIDNDTSETFSIGELSFPPPYLKDADEEEIASRGILKVSETPMPVGQFASVSSSIELIDGIPTVFWQTTPATASQIAEAKFVQAIAAGLSLTSTSAPSLNGVNKIGPSNQAAISAVTAGIAAGQGLPGSGATFVYLDAGGAPHQFSATQFVAFGAAVRDYVYAITLASSGIGEFPPATIAID